MKNNAVKAFFLAAAFFFGGILLSAADTTITEAQKFYSLIKPVNPQGVRQVYDFVKEGRCSMTPVDNIIRPYPYQTYLLFENRFYVMIGRKKIAGKPLLFIDGIKFYAFKGKQSLEIKGALINDQRRKAKAAMMSAYPDVKKIYSALDDDNTVLLFLTGTAVIYTDGKPPVTIDF